MKIALVWNGSVALDRISFRHENYQAGWEALGHDAVLVTARELVGSFAGRTHLVAAREELERVETWRELAADVAVGVTWHRMSGMLAAIRAAGTQVVAIADSDGQVGFAAHPRISWLRIGAYQTTLSGRLRALRYFCRRFAASAARRDPEELEFVASTRASDRVVLGSAPAIACFSAFPAPAAGRRPRGASARGAVRRAGVVLHPAAGGDRDQGRPGRRHRPLERSAEGRAAPRRGPRPLLLPPQKTEVVLFGADPERAFGELARREPRLRLAGIQEPHVVAQTLAQSRAALFSSRWETGPHVATEALALGATLVSVPMPNLEGMIDGGRFGTLAGRRSPQALAGALAAELAEWDAGRRDASGDRTPRSRALLARGGRSHPPRNPLGLDPGRTTRSRRRDRAREIAARRRVPRRLRAPPGQAAAGAGAHRARAALRRAPRGDRAAAERAGSGTGRSSLRGAPCRRSRAAARRGGHRPGPLPAPARAGREAPDRAAPVAPGRRRSPSPRRAAAPRSRCARRHRRGRSTSPSPTRAPAATLRRDLERGRRRPANRARSRSATTSSRESSGE